jgi:hypothetical protein
MSISSSSAFPPFRVSAIRIPNFQSQKRGRTKARKETAMSISSSSAFPPFRVSAIRIPNAAAPLPKWVVKFLQYKDQRIAR